MDFVHDALADGRPLRIRTVVDQWSRASPLLDVGSRVSGLLVGEPLDRGLADESGATTTGCRARAELGFEGPACDPVASAAAARVIRL